MAYKRDLNALTDYLFDMLDVVTDPELKGEELLEELDRANSVSKLAESLVHVGVVQVSAMKQMNEYGIDGYDKVPALLGGGS